MILYADWKGMIADIDLIFEIPEAGENLGQIYIPGGVRYHFGDAYVVDHMYEDATDPVEAGDYKLIFQIYPDSDAYDFLHTVNEYDGYVYTGTITLNGEEIEVSYLEASRRI